MIASITSLDFTVLNALQQLRSAPLDKFMAAVTYLGSTAVLWILIAAVLAARKSSRKSGIIMVLSMIIGLIAGPLILKNLVMRPRPFNLEQALLNAAALPIPVPMGRYSFPSAHAVTSFAAATGLYFHNKKFGVAAYVLSALIGLSRVYLYVHFPSDVLAGSAIGILCAIAARAIINKIYKKRWLLKSS